MNNNIFTFREKFWLQLNGTAMGTLAAPLYSILTFGHHEDSKILTTFKNNLIFYKRYVNDVFGIWIDTPNATWTHFTEVMTVANLENYLCFSCFSLCV